MEARIVPKEQIIRKAKETYGVPDSVLPLLDIPQRTSVEAGTRFTYYLLPSASYQPDHEDPYYSLTGGKENLGWADYLFGFREDGGRIHVVLIDKKRKIALQEKISGLVGEIPGVSWQRFEQAVKKCLEAVKRRKDANHVEYTAGSPETIPEGDSRAW